jgi:hypothetical protein
LARLKATDKKATDKKGTEPIKRGRTDKKRRTDKKVRTDEKNMERMESCVMRDDAAAVAASQAR